MLLFPVAPSYADVFSFAEANPWVTDILPPLMAPLLDHLFADVFEPSKAAPCAPAEACCSPLGEDALAVEDKGGEDDAPPTSSASRSDDDSYSAACAAASDKEQRSPPEFSRSFDVGGFVAGEVTVKAVGNCIEVHAGHLEKPPRGEDGDFVRREYTHRFTLPDDVQPDSVTSVLTKEGTLVVRAPRNGSVCAEETGTGSSGGS
nr:uncharacterized protein LOC126542943 [Dermacentor andersoni]